MNAWRPANNLIGSKGAPRFFFSFTGSVLLLPWQLLARLPFSVIPHLSLCICQLLVDDCRNWPRLACVRSQSLPNEDDDEAVSRCTTRSLPFLTARSLVDDAPVSLPVSTCSVRVRGEKRRTRVLLLLQVSFSGVAQRNPPLLFYSPVIEIERDRLLSRVTPQAFSFRHCKPRIFLSLALCAALQSLSAPFHTCGHRTTPSG